MTDSDFILQLGQSFPVEAVPFEGVADLNSFGDLVGVEVIGLEEQGGAMTLPPANMGLPRASYDAETDSMYVQISTGGSTTQKSIRGELWFSSQRELSQLRFSLAE